MQTDFFARQHVLFKFFITLILIVFSTIFNFPDLLIAFSTLIVSFLLKSYILKKWSQILIRLFPFFIFFFIFGIIFQIPFSQQAILAIRITYVLLLSVYLISTTPFEAFLADTASWRKTAFIDELRFFLLATFQFIPMFFQAYKDVTYKSKLSLSSFGDALHLCLKNIHEVEESIIENIYNQSRSFDWKSNSYLILLVAVNSILVF